MQFEEQREFRNQARTEASREKGKDKKEHQDRWSTGEIGEGTTGAADSQDIPLTTERGRILDWGSQRRANPSTEEDIKS